MVDYKLKLNVMCGILGSASVKINNINWIRDGLASLAHRGPDRSGIYISKDQNLFCT